MRRPEKRGKDRLRQLTDEERARRSEYVAKRRKRAWLRMKRKRKQETSDGYQ